jgi:hypothetical protein
MRRHRLLERGRLDRLQQALLARQLDSPGVDRDEDVGRALVALGLHALDQRVGIGLDAVDLDPGRLGEVRVELLVGVVVARGVKVQFALALREGGSRGQREHRAHGAADHDRQAEIPSHPIHCWISPFRSDLLVVASHSQWRECCSPSANDSQYRTYRQRE